MWHAGPVEFVYNTETTSLGAILMCIMRADVHSSDLVYHANAPVMSFPQRVQYIYCVVIIYDNATHIVWHVVVNAMHHQMLINCCVGASNTLLNTRPVSGNVFHSLPWELGEVQSEFGLGSARLLVENC